MLCSYLGVRVLVGVRRYLIKAPNGAVYWQPGENRVVSLPVEAAASIKVVGDWASEEQQVVVDSNAEEVQAVLSPAVPVPEVPAVGEQLAAVADLAPEIAPTPGTAGGWGGGRGTLHAR